MSVSPGPVRLVCPACGRFLLSFEGVSAELPPCSCGIQTSVRATGKRLGNWSRPCGVLREVETK